MAIRLLPFRDYDEHEVVNLFRSAGSVGDFIDLSSSTKRSTAAGDAGVFVKVQNGSLSSETTSWDPIDIDGAGAGLLGKTDYPNVARNLYPQVSLAVEPVGADTDACLGVTLRQTVERDENGENLLYNPIKKDELYGVLPGEAVPVLSRGMVTLTSDAINDGSRVGQVLVPSTGGTATGVDTTSVTAAQNVIGTIIASGYRDDEAGSQGGTNVFNKAGLMKGSYYIVKLNCA